jgi:hypothetical protein
MVQQGRRKYMVFVGDRDDGIAGRLDSTRLKGLQVSWPDIILGSEGRPHKSPGWVSLDWTLFRYGVALFLAPSGI